MNCHIGIAALAALMVIGCLTDASASTYRRLYSFQGGDDGGYPLANLIEVEGKLYGTTSGGSPTSRGTIFSMNPKTGTKHVLHAFAGGDNGDGEGPEGTLVAVDGLLYGTTTGGGKAVGGMYLGTVFSLDITTGAYSVLHKFGGPDGAIPVAGMIRVGKDRLYGTTQEGGSYDGCPYGCGTVFELDRKTDALTILHEFNPNVGGFWPTAAMIKTGHTLYGTAQFDTGENAGGVFSFNVVSGKEKTIYEFNGSAGPVQPFGGLVDVDGILYGTSVLGGGYDCDNGSRGCGTIYTADPQTGAAKAVYVFKSFSDGAWPRSALTNVGGILYGTTSSGGSCADNPYAGCGTVFAFDPKSGTKTTIYSFKGGSFKGGKDGSGPWAGLLNIDGVLYGVTEWGGGSATCYPGCGTVFAITP